MCSVLSPHVPARCVELAYGIQKLSIVCTVEDDKISVEDLQERIEGFGDLVSAHQTIGVWKCLTIFCCLAGRCSTDYLFQFSCMELGPTTGCVAIVKRSSRAPTSAAQPTFTPPHAPSSLSSRSHTRRPAYLHAPTRAVQPIFTLPHAPSSLPSRSHTRRPAYLHAPTLAVQPTFTPPHAPSSLPSRPHTRRPAYLHAPTRAVQPTFTPPHAPSSLPSRPHTRLPAYLHAPTRAVQPIFTLPHAPSSLPSRPQAQPTFTPTFRPAYLRPPHAPPNLSLRTHTPPSLPHTRRPSYLHATSRDVQPTFTPPCAVQPTFNPHAVQPSFTCAMSACLRYKVAILPHSTKFSIAAKFPRTAWLRSGPGSAPITASVTSELTHVRSALCALSHHKVIFTNSLCVCVCFMCYQMRVEGSPVCVGMCCCYRSRSQAYGYYDYHCSYLSRHGFCVARGHMTCQFNRIIVIDDRS